MMGESDPQRSRLDLVDVLHRNDTHPFARTEVEVGDCDRRGGAGQLEVRPMAVATGGALGFLDGPA